LVNGATKYKRRLDWIISQLYPEGDDNDGGMETAFRQVLRLALFDMIELGTPSHVINVWVDVSRIMVGERVARLCNALLRKCDRMWQADALPSPHLPPNLLELDINAVGVDDVKKLARMLGVCYSHPDWLIKKWLRSFGVEGTVRLLEHNNAIPEYSARVLDGTDINELLDWMESQGGDAVRSEYLPDDFICVASGMQKLLGDGIINRQIQVQDIAAGLVVVAALDPQPGDKILDCCAAPGGKALFAASRMKGRGRLVAVDLHKNRLLALQKSAEAQGLSAIIETIASDFVDLIPRFKESFDKVLVDAPCSGSGVIAKRADLRWRKSPQDIEELVVLQDRLLDAAAQAVKPGGVLVYSTCSIEDEENRGRVDAFIQRHKGEFVLEGINGDIELKVPRKCLDNVDGKCLTMLPHITGTDGSFAARLRKRRSRG
jgi:16S rRNA (cytosine967-C5)-methyltransferase